MKINVTCNRRDSKKCTKTKVVYTFCYFGDFNIDVKFNDDEANNSTHLEPKLTPKSTPNLIKIDPKSYQNHDVKDNTL